LPVKTQNKSLLNWIEFFLLVAGITAVACVTVGACFPAVAGIPAVAEVPLVPEILTVAGLPAIAGSVLYPEWFSSDVDSTFRLISDHTSIFLLFLSLILPCVSVLHW
jgi:hypothetical protein